jgi:hypothetical protein
MKTRTTPLPEDPVAPVDLPTAPPLGGFRRGLGGRRRGRRRILGVRADANTYHVMSRTTGGEMLFGAVEKEAFRRIMRRLERFAGVQILTYAVMTNHFHILVRVPDRERFLRRFKGEGGEEKLLGHLGALYSKAYIQALRRELNDLREQGMAAEAEALLDGYRSRFCDLPRFVKELKERFSRWFNKRHRRRGTLWMERYKSVIVGDGDALRTMALYIDLNAVRAGLARDPKAYRWCGYAEAAAGGRMARRGLCRAIERPPDSWDVKLTGARGSPTSAELYRGWLLDGAGHPPEKRAGTGASGSGDTAGKAMGKDSGKSTAADEAAGPPATAETATSGSPVSGFAASGKTEPPRKLSIAELLRCRVRYFSDGLAIGGRAFIEELFRAKRECFGPKRRTAAKPITELEASANPDAALHTLNPLRSRTIERADGPSPGDLTG